VAGANEDEVGWEVCDHAGAGVAAHAPGTRGVFGGALPAGWPSEAGIATSEFKLLLQVAALYVVVCLAVLVLPLEVVKVVEGGDFEG
jgi:hypothetical protein